MFVFKTQVSLYIPIYFDYIGILKLPKSIQFTYFQHSIPSVELKNRYKEIPARFSFGKWFCFTDTPISMISPLLLCAYLQT